MILEPKFCEECGRTFLREVGSDVIYCQHHEKPKPTDENKDTWEFVQMMEALMR